MNYNFKWAIYISLFSFLGLQGSLLAKECKECITPSIPRVLLPPQEDGNNYYLTAGFLYEQVRMTGLQYAYTKNGNAIGATALPATGTILEPSFNPSFGFTGGLAYYFCNKNWTLNTRFDWLQSTGKANTSVEFNDNIIPVNMWRDQFFSALDADLGVAGQGISKFTVSYYNLNIDLNRELYIDQNFTLEPHMGLKLSFIYDQAITQFTGNGSDTSFSSVTDLNTNLLQRTQKTNFWGVGPSLGIDSDWNLFCDVSLFMEGSAAILLGYSKATDAVVYPALSSSQTQYSTSNIPVFSPSVQALLGLKYETLIYCDSQRLVAKLGWDSSIYWNQWNHINSVSEATFNSSLDTASLKEGDTFGLTGLLLSLTWNF